MGSSTSCQSAIRASAVIRIMLRGGAGGDELCFPADATVTTPDGTCVAMSDLQIGDIVLAISAEGLVASEVCAFAHRDSEVSASFVVISTDSGHSLVLTAEHLVPICFKGMEFIHAGNVMVGHKV